MLTQPRQQDIRTVAQRLWEDGVEAEPAIRAAYLFPSEKEIRLVYLDPTTTPSSDSQIIQPYYFGVNVASGLPYPSAIAMIRPEEKERLAPPDGWGTWTQAELVWES